MATLVMSFEYTPTVDMCLKEIINHLRRHDINAGPVIKELLEEFERKVRQFPQGCHVCPELLKIGCGKYRECNTSRGYRILYSVDAEVITVHAVLAQKQDIKQLLFKRLLLM